jgi:hypothetical protein
MKDHFNTKKDESAQKIQAFYKGYSIRKHFLAVRHRFERILKSIEGNLEVHWSSSYLCRPVIKDPYIISRLKELDDKRNSLEKELESIERQIQGRKTALMNPPKSLK